MEQENKRKTILVVEDERPLIEAIRFRLDQNNFDVLTARTVAQAKTYLEDIETIDAVWLDHYLLGQETGLDLVHTMKGDGAKWKNIPIFVVSNTASDDKVRSYLLLGISKYYVKSEKRLDSIIPDIKAFLDSHTASED